jgi:hypothetical protein
VDPVEVLQDQERLLAAEYGVTEPPRACAGENLRCDDPEEIRHWAIVYTELVDFTHRVLAAPGWSPTIQRTVALHATFRELHLAYWTDRLRQILPELSESTKR